MTLRVLVVEDEFLVGLLIEEVLRELACEIVGPIVDVHDALAVAQRETLDGALLDINLNGRVVYPVAELLQERRIPFAFTTGYAGVDLPPKFRSLPRIQKPVALAQLTDIVSSFGRAKGGESLPTDPVGGRQDGGPR
jgi:CheY-like chemotaxis protein